MQLQVALDVKTIDDALAMMRLVAPYVDIVEVGTPLVVAEGARAARALKDAYPDKCVLFDAKIMDGGRSIAELGFKAGADVVTVLGITNDSTVAGAVEAAGRYDGYVCADTIGIRAEELASRTRELEALGVGSVAVHTAHDMLGTIDTPVEALRVIKENLTPGSGCLSVISGGVKPGAMAEIVAAAPDVVISGSGIIKADDPAAAARAIKEAMGA